MAEETTIEWTDATVNFWRGCTKVGLGCENCYAESWSGRFGESLWGAGVPRRKIKGAVALLHRLDNGYSWWAADCYIGKHHPNPRRRVFVQSMSDLFDLEVPVEWFAEAWKAIKACDWLDIQIVTKRISAVRKRLAEIGETEWPRHVGLIISVVNQPEADRDVPRLLALKRGMGLPWVGLSMEPLLGLVNLSKIDVGNWAEIYPLTGTTDCVDDDGEPMDDLPALDWVIVGGESGRDARPMHPDWARSLRDQCVAAGVPFLFKQWGEWQHGSTLGAKPNRDAIVFNDGIVLTDFRRETAIAEDNARGWHARKPEMMARVGKNAAGRELDGRTWDQFPGGAV